MSVKGHSPSFSRRLLGAAFVTLAVVLIYTLRGVLISLFLAFLVAYALEPLVELLERWRVPRSVGAPLVMLALVALAFTLVFLGVPFLVDEFHEASRRLPSELANLRTRAGEMLWLRLHYKLPATWSELFYRYGAVLRDHLPEPTGLVSALFGTFNAIFVLLGLLVVPIFALYLLGDFDRIIRYTEKLIPRRFAPAAVRVAAEIHTTLGRYVRGQLITSAVLAVLYATGLRIVGIRLAIPIGILTGLFAFIPYMGLALGTLIGTTMAVLDWHGPGQIAGVLFVMVIVGGLDGFVITPRIVGGSVGLKPLEVLLTMMAAATLFGFLGVLLAVPLGAVLKILVRHGVDAYLSSRFYLEPPPPRASLTPPPPPPLPALEPEAHPYRKHVSTPAPKDATVL